MDIIKNEIKKVVKSPIIIILTVIFILFNLLVISKKWSYREDLQVLNKIDKHMLINFKDYVKIASSRV